jgi:hypothetical protein
MNGQITKTMPAWLRCHERAMRSVESAMVFTALEGMELLKERRACPEGKWMQWLEDNYPGSRESARVRIHLGEELEQRLEDEAYYKLLGIDGAAWFLGLADREDEPSAEELNRAMTVLRSIMPASNPKQLFIEAGAIKPVPKPEPKPARATEPRPPRPPILPHVRVWKSWAKLPDDDKRSLVREHAEEFERLLEEIRNPALHAEHDEHAAEAEEEIA